MMEGNDLLRWLTLKQAAARCHLWVCEDREAYALASSAAHRIARRRDFIRYAEGGSEYSKRAMRTMGLTEEDQFYD